MRSLEQVANAVRYMDDARNLDVDSVREVARTAMDLAQDCEGEEWAYQVAKAAQRLLQDARLAHH
jgi:hypothetical protein